MRINDYLIDIGFDVIGDDYLVAEPVDPMLTVNAPFESDMFTMSSSNSPTDIVTLISALGGTSIGPYLVDVPSAPDIYYGVTTSSDMRVVNSGVSQLDRDSMVAGYKQPIYHWADSPIANGIEEGLAHIAAIDDVRLEVYTDSLVTNRPVRDITGIHDGSVSSDMVSTWDVLAGKGASDPNYLDYDYLRKVMSDRYMGSIGSMLTSIPGVSLEALGDYSIELPDAIPGSIFKVSGVVQQKGNVPSYPTTVMVVDRTGGELSTVSIAPNGNGEFCKYYSNLSDDAAFMVIGLWDPKVVPYFKPVITDNVKATLVVSA